MDCASPYLPWPVALVYISGVAEILLGTLLMLPRTSRLAGWGLIALLVAVFPANIHMALHPELYPTMSPRALWIRLPLQGVLIALAVGLLTNQRRRYWSTSSTLQNDEDDDDRRTRGVRRACSMG